MMYHCRARVSNQERVKAIRPPAGQVRVGDWGADMEQERTLLSLCFPSIIIYIYTLENVTKITTFLE